MRNEVPQYGSCGKNTPLEGPKRGWLARKAVESGLWLEGEALVVVSLEYGRLSCHYAGGSMVHQRRVNWPQRRLWGLNPRRNGRRELEDRHFR
jgi:hypothetical protein